MDIHSTTGLNGRIITVNISQYDLKLMNFTADVLAAVPNRLMPITRNKAIPSNISECICCQ